MIQKERFDEEEVEKLNLTKIKVRDVYEQSEYLPERMAKLIPRAWESLQKVIEDVEDYGGNIRLSDAFRDNRSQMKAHLDYKMGRKEQYSPPPGLSMHEAGRAIDIDWRYESLGLKQTKIAEILREHGWNSIVSHFGDPTKVDVKEEHHWEYREGLEEIYDEYGYKDMAEYAIKQVDNFPDEEMMEESYSEAVKDAQKLLEDIGIDPGPVDGVFGPKTERAILEFQKKNQFENPDGQVDIDLIMRLLKTKNSNKPKDDKRHVVRQKIQSIVNDLDRLKQNLKETKSEILKI